MKIVTSYVGFLNALDDREKKIGVTEEFYEWLNHSIRLTQVSGKKKDKPIASYSGMEIYIVK